MTALDRIRQGVIVLARRAQDHETGKMLRKGVLTLGAFARRPADVAKNLAGLQRTMDVHEAETSSWVPATELAAGRGGPFDACDLRHWLVLAERAGVPFVPAREILALDDEEMSAASGTLDVPDVPTVRNVRKRLAALPELAEAAAEIAAEPVESEEDASARKDALSERLAAAMDGVPEGWMVRFARCGGTNLKSLAGMGMSGTTVPEVRFGPDLEVGPGWVRRGNRRSVDVGDNRTVAAAAQGAGAPHVFLARPWVRAARWAVGEDPHRHGTPFAGKGAWPSEWRAFVELGQVVGVASYYGWCGSVTAENALVALRVRDLAQRIADEAVRLKAWPRYEDVEMLRMSGHPDVEGNPNIASALALFGREEVGCTLDFIEVEDEGLMLLEGGPPNTPFGGGHPCAFAGCGGLPLRANKTLTVGVAFRTMDHVLLAEPRTWTDGERADCILTWEEAEAVDFGEDAAVPERV